MGTVAVIAVIGPLAGSLTLLVFLAVSLRFVSGGNRNTGERRQVTVWLPFGSGFEVKRDSRRPRPRKESSTTRRKKKKKKKSKGRPGKKADRKRRRK